MCGIAGQVDFTGQPAPAALLRSMLGAIARRGPDAQATWTDGPCALVHTRLSIIDVAGSPQPMTADDGAFVIAFNGEIFNYQALRGEMAKAGESFATAGDTEVLLRLAARHGPEGLRRLDGQFAFALWDKARQRLLLARDPLGEKPLYYATPSPGVLVFGSELKAVLAHPAVDRGLDEDGLRQALRFRTVYGEGSLHRGVRQLRPGSWLRFDRDGIETGAFYDLVAEAEVERPRLRGLDQTALIERGRELLIRSVRGRLIADVPVGAFLSGGLDSSLIVALMRQLRGPDQPICTFSVGFVGDPHSELGFAQSVAEAFDTRHQAVEVGPEAFIRRLPELAACRDGPVSEPADVAVAEMSAVARQSVKVVLSGEGADEVFAGYPKYRLAKAPGVLRSGMRLLGAERASALGRLVGLPAHRTRIAARALAAPNEAERLAQWFSYLDRAELQTLFPGLGWESAAWSRVVAEQRRALARADGGPLAAMQAVDCLTWLPGNMLERGDRMTMAEGLEMRPPFLDAELAAFGLALPDRMKVRGRVGKWIVRRWADDLLPEAIVNRRKWGFRVPLDLWFRGPLRDHLQAYLLSDHGLCATYGDRAAIRRLLDSHLRGEVDHSGWLWSVYTAEIWYQDVFLPRLAETPAAAVA
jgi:asparagine synthase (glutamine-hydrolysing)